MAKENPSPGNIKGKSLFRWLIPSWKVLKWGGLLVLSLGLIGVGSLRFYVQHVLIPQVRDVYQYDRIRLFWDTPVSFSEKDFAEVKVSEELAQTYARIKKIRAELPNKADIENYLFYPNLRVLTSEERDRYFEDLEPYIQAGMALSRQIDNEIQTLTPDDLLPIYHPDHAENKAITTIFQLKFERLTEENRVGDAIEYGVASLPLMLECPYQACDAYFDQLIKIQKIIQSISTIMPFHSPQERWRAWLATLNRLDPFLFRHLLDRSPVLMLVTEIRKMRQQGIAIDTTSGKKAIAYIRQLSLAQFPEMNPWRQFFRYGFHAWGEGISDTKMASILKALTFYRGLDEFFYLRAYSFPAFPGWQKLETRWATEFDTLRLLMAARLYEKDTGKKVTATLDLVPTYLPHEIKNRENSESYRWDAGGNFSPF